MEMCLPAKNVSVNSLRLRENSKPKMEGAGKGRAKLDWTVFKPLF